MIEKSLTQAELIKHLEQELIELQISHKCSNQAATVGEDCLETRTTMTRKEVTHQIEGIKEDENHRAHRLKAVATEKQGTRDARLK
jgi:DNA anti-recombination protein RmuC